MGVGGQPGDVGHAVAGIRAGTEGGTADVHRVRPVVDGFDAEIGVLGRGEQFEVAARCGGRGGERSGHGGHREQSGQNPRAGRARAGTGQQMENGRSVRDRPTGYQPRTRPARHAAGRGRRRDAGDRATRGRRA
ncbi:hypothetical protein SDC9_204906 [bioreactor metagenome]|uniref:Uncharacterized protein n=1 Tax=bioreactor metagenome TaxID=1076179 RepID=A0A645J271_9ZZZZ